MKILSVSTSDASGGAARAAWRIHQAVKALNLHYLDMEGYEADDLIASYAEAAQAVAAGSFTA